MGLSNSSVGYLNYPTQVRLGDQFYKRKSFTAAALGGEGGEEQNAVMENMCEALKLLKYYFLHFVYWWSSSFCVCVRMRVDAHKQKRVCQ